MARLAMALLVEVVSVIANVFFFWDRTHNSVDGSVFHMQCGSRRENGPRFSALIILASVRFRHGVETFRSGLLKAHAL